jgi:photosystem II stability/assembly factor-like uncharacterized protein
MHPSFPHIICILLLTLGGISPSKGQEDWIPLERPTSYTLNSISFLSASDGWVAGNNGTILRTTNGGRTWVAQESGIGANIHKIFFLNSQLGWALAFEAPTGRGAVTGTLFLSTTNGGEVWERFNFPDDYFNDVTFTSPLNGWMGGLAGRFVGTTNAGATWFDAVIDSEHVFNMPVHSIKFRTPQVGYAVGGFRELIGVIWKTTNGGERWKQYTLGDDLHDIQMFDSLHVLCSGGGLDDGSGMAWTSDGGESWTFGYIGYFGVSKAIEFRTSLEGWASLGFSGSYMHSLDGGQTWRVYFTPDTSGINDIDFPDSTTGYMVGGGGMILKYQTVTMSQQVQNGWNLLSLPLRTFATHADSIYPASTSRAFGYSGGYHAVDSLLNGSGYWLKFDSTFVTSIRGVTVTNDTIALSSAWNLVGSVSIPVVVSSIVTVPPGILSSSFFEFDGGYQVADSLKPGRGYWVKAGQVGMMILAGSGVSEEQGTRLESSGVPEKTMMGGSQGTTGTPLPGGIR